jgi:hypothetical protein
VGRRILDYLQVATHAARHRENEVRGDLKLDCFVISFLAMTLMSGLPSVKVSFFGERQLSGSVLSKAKFESSKSSKDWGYAWVGSKKFFLHYSRRRIIRTRGALAFSQSATCKVKGKTKDPIRRAVDGDMLIIATGINPKDGRPCVIAWNFLDHFNHVREVQGAPRSRRSRTKSTVTAQ